jgi:hypothetical protein
MVVNDASAKPMAILRTAPCMAPPPQNSTAAKFDRR